MSWGKPWNPDDLPAHIRAQISDEPKLSDTTRTAGDSIKDTRSMPRVDSGARQAANTGCIYLPVTPQRAPRMNSGDKTSRRNGMPARPIVRKYAEYCSAIRSHWPKGMDFPDERAWIVFYVPMPKSWSKKKKDEMRGRLHQQRPDKDNYEKGLYDAIYYKHPKGKDDSHIADSRITKLWADVGYIEIYLDALPGVETLNRKQAA